VHIFNINTDGTVDVYSSSLTMKLNIITVLLFAVGTTATVDLPPLPPLIVSLLLDMIGAKQMNHTVAMSQSTTAPVATTSTFSTSTLPASTST
jgi:hypothetical protein